MAARLLLTALLGSLLKEFGGSKRKRESNKEEQ